MTHYDSYLMIHVMTYKSYMDNANINKYNVTDYNIEPTFS